MSENVFGSTLSDGPELTVVIPVFCEAEHIADVLETWL